MTQLIEAFYDRTKKFGGGLRELRDIKLSELPSLIDRVGLPAGFDTVILEAGPLFREEPIARIEFGNPPTPAPTIVTIGETREDMMITCIGGFTWFPETASSELIVSVRLSGEGVTRW